MPRIPRSRQRPHIIQFSAADDTYDAVGRPATMAGTSMSDLVHHIVRKWLGNMGYINLPDSEPMWRKPPASIIIGERKE